MKILNLFGSHITPQAREMLASLGDVDDKEMAHPELAEAVEQYDAIFMGLYPEIDAAVLERAKNLKAVATASTNLYHIDAKLAKERGVEVLTLRGEDDFLYTITGTAEMAVGLMIDLMRKSPWAFDDVRQYHWDRESFRGYNLYGKTLGIVGLGRLGSWMAKYGNAFGMKVLAYSPHSAAERFQQFGCMNVNLDTLLSTSDVVSIHAQLTDETRHIFNATAFKKMKSSAFLINTAVEHIVDEDALVAALQSGTIAGYASDILGGETTFAEKFTNHPLVEFAKTHQNCIIVPHLGGMTYESRAATDIFMAEKLKKLLTTL